MQPTPNISEKQPTTQENLPERKSEAGAVGFAGTRCTIGKAVGCILLRMSGKTQGPSHSFENFVKLLGVFYTNGFLWKGELLQNREIWVPKINQRLTVGTWE